MNQQNDQPRKPPKPSSSSPVRILLFVLLGVLVAALAYDQLVARPAVDNLQKQLEDKIIAQNAAPGDSATVSPTQVREMIGHDPVGGMQELNGYKYEEYRWTAGLPIRSYNLVVVYQGVKKPRLSAVGSNKNVETFIGDLHKPDDEGAEATAPVLPLEEGPAAKGSGETKGSGEKGHKGKAKPADKGGADTSESARPAEEKPSTDKPSTEKPGDLPPTDIKLPVDPAPAAPQAASGEEKK